MLARLHPRGAVLEAHGLERVEGKPHLEGVVRADEDDEAVLQVRKSGAFLDALRIHHRLVEAVAHAQVGLMGGLHLDVVRRPLVLEVDIHAHAPRHRGAALLLLGVVVLDPADLAFRHGLDDEARDALVPHDD